MLESIYKFDYPSQYSLYNSLRFDLKNYFTCLTSLWIKLNQYVKIYCNKK